MRRINFPLLIGSIIVFFLIVVAYFPQAFTSRDPLFEEPPKVIKYREHGEWVEAMAQNPMRPNRENIMGTDDAGRDIYARLVYGARNTLKLAFLVALFRTLLALPMGLAAGMGIKASSGVIKIFNTFFSAVPMLIFSFIILSIGYFYRMQMDRAIIAFALVLTLVGWSKIAGMMEDATRRVMQEDFIEGEVAIGKTWFQIAHQNVLPHIIPNGVSLFFKEMAMALFLIAQLAVLLVFVGTTREIKAMAFRANYQMLLEPEWSGMLSRITMDVLRYERIYWVTLFPVLVFSLAIMGINLTGEGLRMEFQKRNSRVISSIRQAYDLFSPKIYLLQLKYFKKYYKPVLLKTATIALVLLYILVPKHQSHYPFYMEKAVAHLQELVKRDYGGRVPGTFGGHHAGEYILGQLTSYGYQVDFIELNFFEDLWQEGSDSQEEGPKRTYKPLAPMVVEKGTITLWNREGEEKIFHLHEDFTLFTLNQQALKEAAGEGFYYRGIAANQAHAMEVPLEEDFFPIVSRNMLAVVSPGQGSPFTHLQFNSPNLFAVKNQRSRAYDLQFVLLNGYEGSTNTYLHRSHAIIPFNELQKELEDGYREMEVTFDHPKLPEYPGRIIEAFLPAKGRTREEPGELVIIGASYDGIHYHGGHKAPHPVMSAAPTAMALEVARVLSTVSEPLEKSVLFLFWDNETERKKKSFLDGSYHFHLTEKIPISMAQTHGYYYFELGYPGFDDKRDLNVVTFPAQSGKKPTYRIGMEMERRLKQLGTSYRRYQGLYAPSQSSSDIGIYELSSPSLMAMRLNAFMTVGLGYAHITGMEGAEDKLNNFDLKRFQQMGQILIDTLTMNPFLMEESP